MLASADNAAHRAPARLLCARRPHPQLGELFVGLANARRKLRLQVGELLIVLSLALLRLRQPLPQVGVLGAQHAVERCEGGHLALHCVHCAPAEIPSQALHRA